MATPQVIDRKPNAGRRIAARYPGLTQREARALDRLRQELRAILSNGEVKSLYLYGSKPRGEANVRSDIDLLLVYDDVTTEQENALEELVVEHLGKPPRIHLFPYRANEVERDNGASPLLYNVSHHGILLEGTPVPQLDIDRRRVARLAMKRAAENFEVAQLAIETNIFPNAISAAYYAAYYAADAALATKGLVTHTHEITETAFTMNFIRAGLVPESFKGLLGRGRKARIQADYKHDVEFGRDDAEYWLERAKEFVSLIQGSLETWLAEV